MKSTHKEISEGDILTMGSERGRSKVLYLWQSYAWKLSPVIFEAEGVGWGRKILAFISSVSDSFTRDAQ